MIFCHWLNTLNLVNFTIGNMTKFKTLRDCYSLLLVAFIFILQSLNLNAQQVKDIKFVQRGSQISITYDLDGPRTKVWYIEIFASDNGGLTWGLPLKHVSGEVGRTIQPGWNKNIIWEWHKERLRIPDSLRFMIVARPDEIIEGNSGVFTDFRNGIKYKWVKIGRQIWMAENLNYGNLVQNPEDHKNNGDCEKFCYNNAPLYCDRYGALYSWDELMGYVSAEGVQGICPEQWHIPTSAEWEELILFLGGRMAAYLRARQLGADNWKQGAKGITNESGFTALPAGMRNSGINSSFLGDGNHACFWTSSESGPEQAKAVGMNSQMVEIFIFNGLKTDAYSVRCVR